MATDYRIAVYTPEGQPLANVEQFASLEYALTENEVGAMTLVIPPILSEDLFKVDTQLAIYRTVDSTFTYLEGETRWFVRKINILDGESGQLMTITAYDAKHLLGRRVVDYFAGSAQATESSTAIDNSMKTVVSENLGSSAGSATGRNISTYLDIEPNLTLLPTSSKSFAWRNVLTVLQEMAKDSAQRGTYASFDVVWTGSKFVFKVYSVQRGVDRRIATGSQLLFALEFGSLSSATLERDWSEEANYVKVGGQGEQSERQVASATDSDRIIASPFNRMEVFQDARNSSTSAQLTAEANDRLWQGQPRLRFTGTVQETTTTRYGREYGFGDLVTARYRNFTFDCRISRVNVLVDEGGEHIEAKVESDTILT